MLDNAYAARFRRDRPEIADDVLSSVVTMTAFRSASSVKLEVGGDWAVRFPAQPFVKFVSIIAGNCWILPKGSTPRLLEEGDTYLLCSSPSYVLASNPTLAPADGTALFGTSDDGVVRIGSDDTVIVAGSFDFETAEAKIVTDILPSLVVIPSCDPVAPVLRATLQLLTQELGARKPGSLLMQKRLGEILFIQALRRQVLIGQDEARGWLRGLGDRRIAPVLASMHANPSRRWTVESLACAAGMSRSSFATAFRDVVGVPPLAYLQGWRMQIARTRLREGDTSIGVLAAEVGYASESAFSHAFRRTHGVTPNRFKRQRVAFDSDRDGGSSTS